MRFFLKGPCGHFSTSTHICSPTGAALEIDSIPTAGWRRVRKPSTPSEWHHLPSQAVAPEARSPAGPPGWSTFPAGSPPPVKDSGIRPRAHSQVEAATPQFVWRWRRQLSSQGSTAAPAIGPFANKAGQNGQWLRWYQNGAP